MIYYVLILCLDLYLILLFKFILVVSSSFKSILSFSLLSTIPLIGYVKLVFLPPVFVACIHFCYCCCWSLFTFLDPVATQVIYLHLKIWIWEPPMRENIQCCLSGSLLSHKISSFLVLPNFLKILWFYFFTAEEYSIVYIYNIFIIHPLDQLKDIKVAFIS